LPVQFPAVGLYKDKRDWSPGENFFRFHDQRELTSSTELDAAQILGMQLTDASGKSWRVTGVTPLRSRSFLSALRRALGGRPQLAIDLVEEATAPLDQLKARLCQSVEDWQDDWRDDEAIAGESGPPRDEQEMLEEVKNVVQSAASVADIVGNLDALLEARGLA
jgi:hypothetical protein